MYHTEMKIDDLLFRFLENDVNEHDLAILNQWFSSEAKAVQYYCSYARDYAAMRMQVSANMESEEGSTERCHEFDMELWSELAEVEKTAPTIEIEKPKPEKVPVKMLKIEKPPRVINKSSLWTAIISVAAVLFVLIYVQVAPPPASSVAIIADSINAQWEQSDNSTDIGDRLWNNDGSRWLLNGTVKIEFDYGAEVIVDGPAEFELIDAEKMILRSGRLYATVPKRATGFTIQTPSSTVIDLGTEFGVKVDYDGSSDVHMFKGAASLIPGQAGKKEEALGLLAGQAKRIDTHGQVSDTDLDETVFPVPAQFAIMSKADKGSAYHRWLLYSNELRENPDLVAYYTFEKDNLDSDKLKNVAGMSKGRLDGVLNSKEEGKQSPSWTIGRWPNKTALAFDGSLDQRVVIDSDPLVQLDGPMTIMAWIRFPELTDGGHLVSSRLTDGACNYQLAINRKDTFSFLRFGGSYNADSRVSMMYDSPLSEQWHCIVVSHDNVDLKLYIDGRLYETQPYTTEFKPVNAPLVIGGSRSRRTEKGYSGLIGELAIFNRVLSKQEIREIYEAGKP